MIVMYRCLTLFTLIAMMCLICFSGIAGADNATIYRNSIIGPTVQPNATIVPYQDNILTGITNKLFPNNSSAVDVPGATYELTKPFYISMPTIGGIPSWILIVVIVLGICFWLDSGGSTLTLIFLMFIGNAVIFTLIPADWGQTLVVCAVFSLALIAVSALRGRG